MESTALFEMALGLTGGWKVKKSEFRGEPKKLEIYLRKGVSHLKLIFQRGRGERRPREKMNWSSAKRFLEIFSGSAEIRECCFEELFF